MWRAAGAGLEQINVIIKPTLLFFGGGKKEERDPSTLKRQIKTITLGLSNESSTN